MNRKIRASGYKLVLIWEHDWVYKKKYDDDINNFVTQLDIESRLDPRESFFGGRTSPLKLKHKASCDETIRYVDVVSLYPATQYYGRFPVGHPDIIVNDFKDVSEYYGLVKCKMLPPRDLYIPVLPHKSKGGKLTFPLCRSCVDSMSPNKCACTDHERCLTGVWTTPEILAAIEAGYVVTKIYEVHHFPESVKFDAETGEEGLFNDYIACFLKIKAEASGYPTWVKSEADKDAYILDFYKAHKIQLDRENIIYNPGMRLIAKLCLNR